MFLGSSAYGHLKLVLNVQDDWKKSSSGHKECMRYGPVLPQTAQLDFGEGSRSCACARPRCTEEKAEEEAEKIQTQNAAIAGWRITIGVNVPSG
jgi:hypothetical protein